MSESDRRVQRFQRKPEKRQDRGIIAARYHAGQPLDGLWSVAREADAFTGPRRQVVLAECVLPDETILVVRWMRVPDEHPAVVEYEVVKDGDWLYYSESYGSLGDDDTASINQFYEPVT